MNQNFSMSNHPYYQREFQRRRGNDERLVGGFAFPFLLGGVTGAALAPAFWNGGYNRPYYNNYYYPYPVYPPYYYRRNW